jgi:hypothetical protein
MALSNPSFPNPPFPPSLHKDSGQIKVRALGGERPFWMRGKEEKGGALSGERIGLCNLQSKGKGPGKEGADGDSREGTDGAQEEMWKGELDGIGWNWREPSGLLFWEIEGERLEKIWKEKWKLKGKGPSSIFFKNKEGMCHILWVRIQREFQHHS